MANSNSSPNPLKLLLLVSVTWVMLQENALSMSFTPPAENTAPRQGSSGASRQNFQFVPPSDNEAPRQSSGGASRIGIDSSLYDDSAIPQSSSDGISNTSEFVSPSDSPAPKQSTGGSSRGFDLITPGEGSTPSNSNSSESLGDQGFNFIPPPDSAAPIVASGSSSRQGTYTSAVDSLAPNETTNSSSRSNLYGTSMTAFQGINESMLAVTPDSFYGHTLEAHPTILVYLPRSNAQQVVCRLKDESKNLIYEQLLPISDQAGIVAIQLPETAPALVINQNYQWFLTLQTEELITPASPFVDAWIKRVEPGPDLAAALMDANSIEAAETLANNGIWYDTVAIMAGVQAKQVDTQVDDDWSELLASVDLGHVAEASIINISGE